MSRASRLHGRRAVHRRGGALARPPKVLPVVSHVRAVLLLLLGVGRLALVGVVLLRLGSGVVPLVGVMVGLGRSRELAGKVKVGAGEDLRRTSSSADRKSSTY